MSETAHTIMWMVVVCLLTSLAWALSYPSPVQATPAPIPTELNLAGSQWKVELVSITDAGPGFVGYTACDTHHIQILAGAEDKQNIVVHEILHAYLCQDSKSSFSVDNFYYNSKTQVGHEGFANITHVLVDALQRNPSLAAYLAGGGK